MPWTFAHPAAILPLRRLCPRWLSLPALILGSMAPDMAYYVGMHGKWRTFCHSPEGVVIACLPVCLLLLTLLLRFALPLTVLLPEPHRSLVRAELRPSPHPMWIAASVAVVSILLGATTHLLWDSFTHEGFWDSGLLPELNEPLQNATDRSFDVAELLQHLSTAVGATLLAFGYRRAVRARLPVTPPARDPRRTRVLLACAAVAVLVGASSACALTPATLPAYISHRLVRTVVWSTSCFTTLYILASLIWWQRRRDG